MAKYSPRIRWETIVTDKILLTITVQAEGIGNMVLTEVKKLAAAGMGEGEILDYLKRDFDTGGRISGIIRNTFSRTVSETLDWIPQEMMHAKFPGAKTWTWITVSDDRRCDDCAERHGESRTWEEWEAIGLPGAGSTVCGDRCRCELVPDGEYGVEIPEPIQVKDLNYYREQYKVSK